MSKNIYFHVIFVCFVFISNCFAGSDLPYKEGELFVRFAPKADGKQLTATEKNHRLTSISGGTVKKSFNLVPGLTVVKLPENSSVEKTLPVLKSAREILYVEPNYKIKLFSTTPNDPNFVYQWGLHNGTTGHDIHAPEAWDTIHDACDIIVAVIDTGVYYTHPDIAANIWNDGSGHHGYDFFNNDNDPLDDCYHGTHVAGIIGSRGNNGVGVTGVCWNVKIMVLKILNSGGSWDPYGWEDDAIAAIQYAVQYGAKVLNNSWGWTADPSQAVKNAIEAADAAGVLFIAAAGNDGYDNDGSSPAYPASYDCSNIISVMATDNTDDMAYYSNYGLTTVDLAAPGGEGRQNAYAILSTFPTYQTPGMSYYGFYTTNYETISGTSMAAPHVAGACALVWAAHPNLTHLQVKDVIMQSVDPLASLNGLCVTGGRLNLFNAVTATIPPLYLTKTDNAPADGVKPNDRLTYTINYNDAEQTLTNVVLTDTLPAEVLHADVAPSGNGDYNSVTHKVTWTIDSLSPGDSGSVTVTVTVGNTMPSAGHLTNTAKIRADGVSEISAVRQTPYYYMVHNVDQNRWYHTIQSAIINSETFNGDELVAYPGIYGNINFGSKVLTLRSINPNAPLIVAQTIIEGSGSAAVTFNNNNSTINGFTITSADNDDGIYCTGSGSDPNIKNCVIRDNFYGIYCDNSSAPTITNCVIKDNAAGIQCESTGQAKILNNLIVNNGTEDYGSGIVLSYIAADTVIRNNTICGNHYGIYLYGYDEPNISNCIIRGNTNDMDYADIPFDTVNYCCLSTTYEGQDNIAADPCFINASAGDYRLKFLSPCVDAGNPTFTPGENETDVYNSYRLLDGDRDGTARIDIGAAELFLQDFNKDRIVNFLDFSLLANVWQTSWTGNNSKDMYDINNDNQIDTKDLGLFTASWLDGTAGQQFAAAEPQTIQPLLYLTYDANTPPDANGEVIVYVHTAVSLVSMEMRASVVGDANIISAMSTADCNQYGWDSQYSDDPNIDDSNGIVQIT
ncbi:MAG: S8 family serine peptidase, partial [Phycisphaerae bacterium]